MTFSRLRKTIVMLLAVLAAIGLLSVAGCGDREKKEQKQKAQTVTVAPVIARTVPVWLKYLGSTEAIMSVDVRARVEGFLVDRNFTEGQQVKEGDLLFGIDPREYEIAVEQDKAALAKNRAALDYARLKVKRYQPLARNEYASEDTLNEYQTQEREAHAEAMGDAAQLKQSELNLGYCYVYSPLNGTIGKTQVDVGNLVGAGEMTVLANIKQLDPLYVYFNPSEHDYQAIMAHKQGAEIPVRAYLPGFNGTKSYNGYVDFIDNTVDQSTNTITMRAKVGNPDRDLLPGVYVQVRLFLMSAPGTLLIPQQALMEGQAGKYVYSVDTNGTVRERDLQARFTYKGMQIVNKGLTKGEHVIIEGQQQVRPGMKVETRVSSFDVPGQNGTGTPQAPESPKFSQPDGKNASASPPDDDTPIGHRDSKV